MHEVGAIIDATGAVCLWHEPAGRSSGAIPDDASLWNALWERRDAILGFAHSHPGSGTPAPSYEDLTTFAAIEAALGARLQWWIVNADHVIALRWYGPEKLNYDQVTLERNPEWVAELRRRSEIVT